MKTRLKSSRGRSAFGTILALAFWVLFPPASSSAPYHGHFIICSDAQDLVKMTADLSDGKGEKVAVGVLDGQKLLFPEMGRGRTLHRFAFYPAKKTPLLVTRVGQKEAEIRLTLNPEASAEGGPERLHERTDPFLYRISRYEALLTLRSLRISDHKVTCTESQWESD